MSTINVLFLDDDKCRVDSFIERTKVNVDWVFTKEGFIQALNSGKKYDLIMLDHDLGLVDFDGAQAAKYLAESPHLFSDKQTVLVHSANIVGAGNMISHMKNSDHLIADVQPYAWFRCRIHPQTGGLQFGDPMFWD